MSDIEVVNGVASNSESRDQNDLDNIRVGTPAKGGAISLYCNVKEDSEHELKALVDKMVAVLGYAKERV